MLKEYNFSRGVRGKYAKRYAQGANAPVKHAHADGGVGREKVPAGKVPKE